MEAVSTGFSNRLKKGQIAMDKFVKKLDSMNIGYSLTGYENWISKNGFKDRIIRINTKTSENIRYFPDLSVISEKQNDVILIEIKNSSGIEKKCYEHYMELEKIYKIYIVFYKNEKFYYSEPSNTPFQKSNIKNFSHIPDISLSKLGNYAMIGHWECPVTDDGIWFLMQRLKQIDIDLYFNLKRYLRNSGNDFAFIDFSQLKELKFMNMP